MFGSRQSRPRWFRFAALAMVLVLATTALVSGCTPSATPTAAPVVAPTKATVAEPTKAPAAPTAAPGSAASSKDTLVIGIGTNISTPDNHKLSGLPAIGAASQIGDVLVRLDEKGNVVPWLIKSWESADGGKALILTVRENVKLQDGGVLTPEDVRYSIERFRKYSVGKAALEMVTEIKVLDANRLQLTTKAPFAPLLRTLAYTTITIYSKAAIEKWGDDNFGLHVSGPGPYKMVDYKPGDKMVLEAFDDYWAGKPKIKSVTFRMIPEMSARVMGLEAGDLDLIDAVAPQETARLAKNTKLQIINPPSAGIVRLYFNTQKGPLTDKRVRQAIAYAIDRDAIVKNIFLGQAVVSHSFTSPGTFGYTGDFDVYKYDPAKAKALLKEAGAENLKFTLLQSPGRYLLSTEVVEAVKAQLAQVGVTAEIVNMEWGAFTDATKLPLDKTATQASFFWWRSINGDADSAIADFATKFFPPGNNTPFFSNAAYDKLYDAEQAETDQVKREQMLKDMQKILMDELPGYVMYVQPNLWAAKAELASVEISALSCLQPLNTATFKAK
jgi:peptide/nickel transport system substrate-binding protein